MTAGRPVPRLGHHGPMESDPPTVTAHLWRADAVVLFDWLMSTDLNAVPVAHPAQKQALASGQPTPTSRNHSQSAGAGSAGRAVKKRTMSSAAVGDSIIAWTRADISAIG